jgi:DNA-binding MarR family transcriptional regulator
MLKYMHIGRRILIIDKYFKLFMKKRLAAFDLNTAEGMVLLVFYGQNGGKGTTQDQLIDDLRYDKGVMTRTMQALEAKGYLARDNHPKDNRSYVFTLTEQAIDFRPALFALLQTWSEALLQGIDEARLDVVQTTLSEMSQNAMNAVRLN